MALSYPLSCIIPFSRPSLAALHVDTEHLSMSSFLSLYLRLSVFLKLKSVLGSYDVHDNLSVANRCTFDSTSGSAM